MNDTRTAPARGFRAAAATVLLLAGSALAAPDVIRIATNQGQFVIETDDPDVEVMVKQGGAQVTIFDPKTKRDVTLQAGTSQLECVQGKDGLRHSSRQFTMERDGRQIVRVRLEPAVTTRPPVAEPAGEIRRLEGHTEAVNGVALSGDGRRAASSSRDGTVRLWDVDSGKEIRQFEAGPAVSVAISPDGRRILGGTLEVHAFRGALLWDADSGKEVQHFPMGTSWPRSVTFSADGRRALVTGLWSTFVLWDVDTGKQVRSFTSPGKMVTSVAISPDGRWALSGGDHETVVRLWDVDKGTMERVFTGHTAAIKAVAFSPDGRRALSGSEDKTLRLWDVSNGQELRQYKGHTDSVNDVAFTADGWRVLAGGSDGTVRLWDVTTGEELRCFTGHTGPVLSVAVAADGRRAVSGGEDKSLRLWELPAAAPAGPVAPGEDKAPALPGEFKTVSFGSDEQENTKRLNEVAADGWQYVGPLGRGMVAFKRSRNPTKGLAEQKELEQLQGTWALVSVEKNGKQVPPEDVKRTLTFTGDRWVLKDGDETLGVGTFKLIDLQGELKGIDRLQTDGKTIREIYRVEGDTLKYCAIGAKGDRPKEFATKHGWTFSLWKRISARPDAREIRASSEQLAAAKELAKWQGTWLNFDQFTQLTIDGDKWTWSNAVEKRVVTGGTIRFFGVHERIIKADLIHETGGITRAIFRVDGDKMSYNGVENGDRPRAFEQENTWKRQSKIAHGSTDFLKAVAPSAGTDSRRFEGPRWPVVSVAFSPDGKLLASCSSADNDQPGEIKIWDAMTGKERRTLKGHAMLVRSVTFSPNGKTLASGGFDGKVKLWDVTTGQEQATFNGHTDPVYSVTFSPDGKTLAAGSRDPTAAPNTTNSATIRLWDVATGQEQATLKGHTDCVHSVAFSPDGKILASGSWDRTIKLWDVATGKERATFNGHADAVRSVAFTPDGRMLASASEDGTIKLWEVSTTQERVTLKGHTKCVPSVAFSPDGKTLASGSLDHTVKLWDVATGQERTTLKEHVKQVWCVAFSPDGKTLASASSDTTVILRDLTGSRRVESPPTGNRQQETRGASKENNGKAKVILMGKSKIAHGRTTPGEGWQPYDREAEPGKNRGIYIDVDTSAAQFKTVPTYITSLGGEECHWEVTGSSAVYPRLDKEGKALPLEGGFRIYLKFPSDPEKMKGLEEEAKKTWYVNWIAFGDEGVVNLPKPLPAGEAKTEPTPKAAAEPVGEIRRFVGHREGIIGVALSPDGRFALSGGEDFTVRLWEVATGKELRRFEGPTNTVYSVAFSPDGTQVLSAGSDATIRLWDKDSGKELRRFEGHTERVACAVFSPDGKRIVSCSQDRTIRLWDVATGKEIRRFDGHTHYVWSVAFSPDGKRLLSGSFDLSVRLWDVETGKEVRRFAGHTAPLYSVRFCRDGRRGLSGAEDKTFRLWDLDTGKEIRKFEGHQGLVYVAGFSPDGRRVLTSSYDGTLRLWDVESGKELYCFHGHTAPIRQAAISGDGRFAVSGSGSPDKTVRLWRLPPADNDPKANFTAPASKNPEVKEPKSKDTADGWVPLFNGKDLAGWFVEGGNPGAWQVERGELLVDSHFFPANDQGIHGATGPRRFNFLLTEKTYSEFLLRFEFQLSHGANSGVALWATPYEKVYREGPIHLEVKLLDDPSYPNIGWPTGTLFWNLDGGGHLLRPDRRAKLEPVGSWNQVEVEARAQSLRVSMNGLEVLSARPDKLAEEAGAFAGLMRCSGHLGFEKNAGVARFRKIALKELKPATGLQRPQESPGAARGR